MMIQWIRNSKAAAGLWAVIRIYLGYSWLTGGLGKLTGGGFDASGFLQGAVAQAGGDRSSGARLVAASWNKSHCQTQGCSASL